MSLCGLFLVLLKYFYILTRNLSHKGIDSIIPLAQILSVTGPRIPPAVSSLIFYLRCIRKKMSRNATGGNLWE